VAEPGVTDAFHRLYYDSAVWKDTYWRGTRAQKCPLDLWIYQEILHETRPDLILETGTAHRWKRALPGLRLRPSRPRRGRHRRHLADRDRPDHARITYLTGSSTAGEVVDEIERHVLGHNVCS
jgi:cephalosporin hydroxylase